MDVKGLKLEGEVDIMSFNYLVMPDKLMEARSFEGPLLILSKTLVFIDVGRANF